MRPSAPLWRTALLLLLVCSLLTGCYGFKDIDKRFFVVAIGIDPGKHRTYKVMLKLAIPSPQEKFGSNRSIIVEEEADTMAEAVRIMKGKVDKEFDFGHAKAIIFGNKLFDSEIPLQVTMDWFLRRRDIQLISWTGIGYPDAYSILQASPRSERLPSNMLFLFFGAAGTETGYVVSEFLYDFRRRMTERGLDPIMPIIRLLPEDQLNITSMTVFDKEHRRMDLSPEETKIFNSFYNNKIDKVDLAFEENGHRMVMSIDQLATSFGVRRNPDGSCTLLARQTIHGLMEESQTPIPETHLPELEKLAEAAVRERTLALLQKFQAAGLDPIGFGLKYRASHWVDDADWQRWQHSFYPAANFEVTSKVNIRSPGIMIN
ncbi:Ger(x)C family spore germination protein [Paenibacillus athensensis]|uniref:Uncharacterized protein n=1 Tax=Paenibacillus athensensis TaxID=1967502 RepID=A0A4Y8Q336_9BACL|nr:Ger(x)C family spore germination protein [Paenibacillus athensensis]MCD1259261.1 Ger(x)C family spore germination protein [Paenibacillus athensensis]